MEQTAFRVASSLLASGLMWGGAEIRQQRLGALRMAEFGDDLDALATEFNRALRDAIEEFDAEHDTKELAKVADDWDAVARELYDIDDLSDLDGETATERLAFKNKEDAVEQVAEAIAAADGYDLSSAPQLERDLKRAVTVAFGEAVGNFAERIADTERAETLLTEAQIGSLSELHDLREDLDDLANRLEAPKFYWKFDVPADGLDAASEVVEPRQIEFVERPEIEDKRDFDRLLLLGPGGSGKSRAMAELVATYECDVAHVVVPRESLTREEHLSRLRRESFEGDVLLVWDDVHAISPERENAVFRDAMTQLEDEILDDDHDLRVLVAARTENLTAVPGDPRKDEDPLWSDFDVVNLESLQSEVLYRVFRYALAEYEVEISKEVAETFLQKAIQTDPSPLYVTSVVQTAENDRLTEDDIEELPEDALSVWQDQYRDIKDENGGQRFILLAVKLLDALHMPPYRSLLKGLYIEVLGQNKLTFDPPVEALVERQWLVPSDDDSSEIQYEVHDVKIEAIDEEIDEWLWELSDFLRDDLGGYLPDIEEAEQTLHGNLANLLREKSLQQSNELAATHYEYILDSIKADDAKAHSNYALLLENEFEEFERAADHFERAIDADPTLAEAHYNYAILLKTELEESGIAADHFERAIDANPDDATAHYNYALLLQMESEEFNAAANHYEQAIDADPEYTTAHYNYATLLMEDDPEKAKDHLKTSVECRFESNDVENTLLSLQILVHLCRSLDHESDAQKYCEQALELLNGTDTENSTYRLWFRSVEALLSDEEEETRFQLALGNVLARNANVAIDLFKAIWERRHDSDHDEKVLSLKAGVALAAQFVLLDEFEMGQSQKEILSEIDAGALSDSAFAVYDYLETGEISLSADDLRDRAEKHQSEGAEPDALEAHAFAVLLDELT